MSETDIKHATALEMAARQREISVSEFFLKNRHLLGFDSPSKAVVTAVKEAVDNALDACEEAGILPEIRVEVTQDGDNYRVVVEDNGPGIVEKQIARIFGKLLYGSKFHKLSQSRGQQGMGISAAGMYAQLTTGKPMHILSRVEGEELASELFVSINTARNRPDIHRKKRVKWDRPHGTRVEVEMEGRHQTGAHSVEAYLKQVAIANPHVTLSYQDPHGELICFKRYITDLPPQPRQIKPHPYGVELGRLIQMLSSTRSRTLRHFLEHEFSRVGRKTALEIIELASAGLSARSYPTRIAHAEATRLHRAIRRTRITAPRTDCIVPIGEAQLRDGLRKELDADFYTVTTRPPAVYRGNPFQVEVGIAYGRPGRVALERDSEGHIRKTKRYRKGDANAPAAPTDEPTRLLRYANRVPLLYQQPACAITRAAIQTNWRAYGLKQSKGALPVAPMAILVHLASVWVPYTSESKEAIAPYPEILKELKLGLQECGRQLAGYLRRGERLQREYERRTHIEKYLPHIGIALQEILALTDKERDHTMADLDGIIHSKRKS
jgi:DNA topoisomerase-6 subunit B